MREPETIEEVQSDLGDPRKCADGIATAIRNADSAETVDDLHTNISDALHDAEQLVRDLRGLKVRAAAAKGP